MKTNDNVKIILKNVSKIFGKNADKVVALNDVNLEILALYILQVNFEVKRTLIDEFKWFQDPNNYFPNLDLIVKCGITQELSDKMWEISNEAISFIKG